MVHGSWFMVHRSWFMVYGSWFIVYGSWFMVHGIVLCKLFLTKLSKQLCTEFIPR
jgi:hypothetical protein